MQRGLQGFPEVKSPASAITFSPTGTSTGRTFCIATLGCLPGRPRVDTLKLTALAVVRLRISARHTTPAQATPRTHRKGDPHDDNDHDPAREDQLDTYKTLNFIKVTICPPAP
jgi:hypothetical protein